MPDTAITGFPTLLFVVPDALFVPRVGRLDGPFGCRQGTGVHAHLAGLISSLFQAGADVHVVQPFYRNLMQADNLQLDGGEGVHLPAARVHMAQDRAFDYAEGSEKDPEWLKMRTAVAFQREVLYRWVPEIGPDLVLCYDWMCGLLPAALASMDLPTLFNVGDRQSRWVHLRLVEEMGLDTAQFWRHLYYRVCPEDYPRALKDNAVNFLLSGIRAATMTNLVGTAMFVELAAGLGGDCATALQGLLRTRFEQGAVITICEETYATDDYLSLCEGVLNRPILKDSNHAGHGTKSESALSSLPPGGVALHHHG